MKEYLGRESSLRRNMENTFGQILGQCSSSLQSRIKGHSLVEDSYDDLDTVWLVKELKMGVSIIDNKSDSRLTVHKSLGELYHLKQGETESNDRFLELIKSCVNTVELAEGKSIFPCQIICRCVR